ncbi:protein transporter SEC24 [Artomyces pyxidatus]|uniref:Protein transporter SEC24 n=1 Tax=Artomyces pyxidatus TaxID=48021 RepID=A0ACB8TEP2_9AGAM|nr:protein transporter SEC24 [Artomyces pyxidatus]
MYAHGGHIPQPPHSAGATLKGLRTHIEPHQVPSPVDSIEADRAKWEDQTYMTLPGNHVPQSTTDYVAIDQGNSSPKFIRMSTWNIPSTSRLAEELDIPIVAVIQPFADLDPREEPVPVIECGEEGPPRCEKCRGYINAWCTWTAGGNRWKCNLCGHETEVSADYFSPLDANLLRVDQLQRPELTKGTIDFAVTKSSEYWAPPPPAHLTPSYVATEPPPTEQARKPQPMRHVFAFDVSNEAVHSGFLSAACTSLRIILYGGAAEDGTEIPPSFPPESSIAIITFDTTMHFYDLSPNQATPRMLVVSDIDEPYLPLPSAEIFTHPMASRTVIESFLESLPRRFADTFYSQSCLGSALRAGLSSLAKYGGHILAYVSTLPTLGPGALAPISPEEETKLFEKSHDKTLYAPRAVEWRNLAEECVEAGVGVSLVLAPGRFVDIGSIGALASASGGELFFHPRFDPVRDGPILESQVRRLVSRTTGYNCALRVRSSNGLRPTRPLGNFHLPAPNTPSFGTLDADKAFSIELEHTRSLSTHEYAFIQCAVLYTSAAGERRVRVLNLAVQVAELAGSVFRFADMDVVVSHMARHAMARMSQHTLSIIRDELTELCSAILYSYRRNCAASTAHTQLIIPEAFRALPMYTLAIHKSKPLKARNVAADVRNYNAHRFLGLSVRGMMFHLYPRLLALHDLDDKIALPDLDTGAIEMPSLMRGSYLFMEAGGLYLIDNEELQVLWIGQSVSPQLLQDVFGVDDVADLDTQTTVLPQLPSVLSRQIRNIIAYRRREKGGRATKLILARQNLDGAEIEFADMLVEDHNNAALSYLDYLSLVHKQITAAIQTGASLSPGTSIRAPW